MTPNEFRTELKKLRGGYLFCGEEDYLKRHYLSTLRKTVLDEGDVFNHIVLGGENYSPERLFAAIESLPMMAEKKLIEVNSLYISSMSESELEALSSVLIRLPEYEYNVLVLYTEPDEFDIGTKKAPSKEFKLLSECLTPVVFEKETPSRLASWVAKHFASELIVAPPDTVTLLIDRCGCDMYALSNEIDKLSCYLKAQSREKLTLDDVNTVCGERKEIAAFDFANAILDGSVTKAFSVLDEMKKQKEKPEIILGSISRVICDLEIIKYSTENGISLPDVAKKLKLHEYKASLYAKSASRTTVERLRELSEKCYEADLLIKSSKLDNYVILEQLVVESTRR